MNSLNCYQKIIFVIANKGYDSEALRNKLRMQNSSPVIPRQGNSKIGNSNIDWCLFNIGI